MLSNLYLRALDPKTEGDLFREAFDWRKSPRRDRVAFEVFAADNPRQIVMGLFDSDKFLAVYVFYQVSPDTFDCHYTCRRDAPKNAVWAAGRQLVEFFSQNSLILSTHVARRNKPLRRWVESIGLRAIETQESACKGQNDSCTLSATTDTFVEYRSPRVNDHGPFGIKTEESGHVSNDGLVQLLDPA